MDFLAALPLTDLSWIHQPDAWIALLTLTVFEIELDIDNIVFISILVSRLPAAEQPRARFLGLSLAMVMRLILLFSISWVMTLNENLFTVLGHGFSGKDLILVVGGLFLLFKSTKEIHHNWRAIRKSASGRAWVRWRIKRDRIPA